MLHANAAGVTARCPLDQARTMRQTSASAERLCDGLKAGGLQVVAVSLDQVLDGRATGR
jgi:hypothetical protein